VQGYSQTVPNDLRCTNFKAKVQALIHAANTIKEMVLPNTQIVFLTDAKSVLEGVNKLSHLLDALQDLRCTRMVLQWIPSHCGIQSNEKADKMAKHGAEKSTNKRVSLQEMNTMIKSMYRTPCSSDNYHQLSRKEQVIIFCH
jgi:ribonuclease HI